MVINNCRVITDVDVQHDRIKSNHEFWGILGVQEAEWKALVGSVKEHPHSTSSINYQRDLAARQTSQTVENLVPWEFYSLCYQHCVVPILVIVLHEWNE